MIPTAKTARHPLRIICADDNVELVELIAESLQFYGYHVEWVFDGSAALEIITPEPEKFDLLITDMQMPQVDGHDLIVKARQAGFRGKVIVFAGALSPYDRERLGALSVEAIIDKPANHRQLIGVVARLQTELWEQANADAA
jgi:CheY-like chemotaxis protein